MTISKLFPVILAIQQALQSDLYNNSYFSLFFALFILVLSVSTLASLVSNFNLTNLQSKLL
jgi:hypothetical protein